MNLRIALIATLTVAAVSTDQSVAQQAVGAAERVQRGAQQTVQAQTSGLAQGDAVFQQARLLTDETGSGLVRFDDGTGLTIAASSDVVVDEFVYNPSGRQSMVLRLGVGAMRFVSGQIDKEAVRIQTPVAVLGIRGTDFTVDTRLPNLLRVWLEEGEIYIVAGDSGLVFEYTAPARADCTPIACRDLVFSNPPRAFQSGGRRDDDDRDDDQDNYDRDRFDPGGNDGGDGGEGGGNGGRG